MANKSKIIYGFAALCKLGYFALFVFAAHECRKRIPGDKGFMTWSVVFFSLCAVCFIYETIACAFYFLNDADTVATESYRQIICGILVLLPLLTWMCVEYAKRIPNDKDFMVLLTTICAACIFSILFSFAKKALVSTKVIEPESNADCGINVIGAIFP